MEKLGRVSASAQGGVDEDSPMFQRREEELCDSVCEYRLVVHIVTVRVPWSRSRPCPGIPLRKNR